LPERVRFRTILASIFIRGREFNCKRSSEYNCKRRSEWNCEREYDFQCHWDERVGNVGFISVSLSPVGKLLLLETILILMVVL
jgi:hypothetical protein